MTTEYLVEMTSGSRHVLVVDGEIRTRSAEPTWVSPATAPVGYRWEYMEFGKIVAELVLSSGEARS